MDQREATVKKPSIFIFAGEASGDLHGEKIVQELKTNCSVTGVGGPKMRQAGLNCILPMEEFQVMGFVDVFFALPKLIRHFYRLRKAILQLKPDLVLFIDYPGFALRMAEHLRTKKFSGKIAHYICPSVWAWGKKRIPRMARDLDLLLTILPFEKRHFEKTTLQVQYVGHPLLERCIRTKKSTAKRVGIFPGSREKELVRNLTIQLEAARALIKKDQELRFVVSVASLSFLPLIEKEVKAVGIDVELVLPEGREDLLESIDYAIAKSGTITLELALYGVPTIVTYGLSKLDAFIAQYLLRLKLPYYCIVNIIAGREVFPELMGPHLNVEALVNKFLKIVSQAELCRAECLKLKEILASKESELSSELMRLIEAKRT